MARGAGNRILVAAIAMMVALSVGTMVGLGVALISDPAEAPDPNRAPSFSEVGGDEELAVVAAGDETTVHGPVGFSYDGEIRPDDRVVLFGPDGREEVGTGPAAANAASEDRPDGLYRIQIEREDAGTVQVVAERTFEVRTPGEPTTVALAAAVGAVFSATASVLGSLAVGQTGVMVQVAQESLIGFGESKLKDAEEKRKAKMGWTEPRKNRTKAQVRRAVIIAVIITVALMAVFFTFEEMDAVTGSQFFGKLPLVAPVAGAMALMAFGSEWLLALATGTVARFKVLWSGAATLILSSTLFRTAFGFPGYVDEDHGDAEELAPHVEGMRGIAAVAAFPAILLPFVIIGWQRFDILSVAMNVGLAGLAAVAMPFRPMPGNDVWRWSKSLSLALWAGAFVLFFGFELGFMSLLQFALIGVVGLITLLSTAGWLFVRRQEPEWYLDWLDAMAALGKRTPRWVKATGRAMAATNGALEAGLTRISDALAAGMRAALRPLAERKQLRELRKGIKLAREAFAKAGPEVDHVSIVQGDGTAISVSRKDLENVMLAQELAEILRSLPRDVDRVALLNPRTGEHRIILRT